MARYCFRITFQTEEAAFYQFHVFPPVAYLKWILGWARKRNANSQLLVLELQSEAFRDRFLELCCENPHVRRIEEIEEEDFTKTASDEV
ncbi:MAG: hypothetical protein JO076_00625 [Verrucomicrobia bacterium]|nr:hypothetical protein [Verrucomicrobiota bacterium]